MAVRQGNTEGTFTTTGQSAVIRCRRADVSLGFAGTGSVNVERSSDDTTYKSIETHTADVEQTYEAGSVMYLRLNCTDATNNIDYRISSDGEW